MLRVEVEVAPLALGEAIYVLNTGKEDNTLRSSGGKKLSRNPNSIILIYRHGQKSSPFPLSSPSLPQISNPKSPLEI
jgi:hypothetical protein